ncbi:MAG TPA: hypothetical protein VK302_12940 [Terriglobales bacterium]|nr:hypothetical protein [Terriglobales bacterium]HXP80519.1 hypothetical protein [Verrucomicrobiae bacterium]
MAKKLKKLPEQKEQKPVRRFTTPEEFRREYYPKSTEREAQQKTQEEGDFGVELAFGSLNRHASVLQLRRD